MNRPAKVAANLYDADFYLWTEEQARALRDAARAGANLPLDWENLAEEIESLGQSNRRELRKRLRQILIHLLKLQATTVNAPRRGWRETIDTQRAEIEDLLNDSPSLRPQIPAILAGVRHRSWDQAAKQLKTYGEKLPPIEDAYFGDPLTPDQVIGDWWPPEPTERD